MKLQQFKPGKSKICFPVEMTIAWKVHRMSKKGNYVKFVTLTKSKVDIRDELDRETMKI